MSGGEEHLDSLKIRAYLEPGRTLEPVTGVGRHANAMVRALAERPGVNLDLLFSREWLGEDARLPANAPLRDLPFSAYALPERLSERLRKLTGHPSLAKHAAGADVVYAPADAVLPTGAVPAVVTLHDVFAVDPAFPLYRANPAARRLERRWRRWLPRLFDCSDAVLTVSDDSRRRMRTLTDTADTPVIVVGNGVSPCFYAIAAKNPADCVRPGPWPYVLAVGGLQGRKGAAEMLAVAAELHRRGSELRVVFVGRPESEWAEAAAKTPNAVVAGPLGDDLMADYLRAAEAQLFLSRYEGFGLPALEAMAAGTPVVAADETSLPEVVGDAGVCLSPDDTTAVTDALLSFAERGPDREELVRKGHARAAGFTWAACAERAFQALSAAANRDHDRLDELAETPLADAPA
ncbi:glycosyltransferase family 4 protein [Alienimonas chondri]|uniref:D-inositol-3-phosphate glycosyltransferase n=1 Tax=Alienimonas chondri TaxID=2681879 RepID=A0ABX1VBG6_9PLAN|nr:glycosyltransferase family 1 protein [Alienimonas chondri]NNJ24391.1 D-inositol-3-phosphate glycosyltransferase [Alienimonas chondri]